MKTLIHALTNGVNKKQVADLILSLRHSVIMAEDKEEVEEITAQCDALLLNLGTPSLDRYEAALRSAKTAIKKGIPYLLDPVGAGVSSFRREHTRHLLSACPPTILRGNASELISLAGFNGGSLGVDASEHDQDLKRQASLKLAEQAEFVIMTGARDLLVHRDRVQTITGGSEILTRVSGMGDALDAYLLTHVVAQGLSLETLSDALQRFKDSSRTAEELAGHFFFTPVFFQLLLEASS